MTALQTFDVEITTLTYGGDGLGRLPDGRAVFVPFVLPGETVRVALTEEKRGYVRAALIEVLKPSTLRILPRCIHFGVCGGCHYQHMPYEAQAQVKAEILRDQLERIGKLEHIPLRPTVPSPQPFYYRNHVQFHLTSEGKLGYHLLTSGEVFAIEECHLPEDPINQVWPQLDFEAIPEIERIGLRLGAGEDVQLIMESSTPEAPEFSVEDLPISAVHIAGDDLIVLAGSEDVVIEVLGRPFRVSAGSFFQVNTPMAEAMVSHVMEAIPRYLHLGPETIAMDVYCGAGLFSAFLAPRVGRLIGIELVPSAVEDFVVNLDEFDHVEIYEAAAEEVLPNLAVDPDLILVDPPRAGLDRPVLDAILSKAPDLLVYVSCDPATLARDLRRLVAGGYQLEQVTPFDLFPQTYHVESIVLMTRVTSSPA